MVLGMVLVGLGGYIGMYTVQKLAKALPEVPSPIVLAHKLKELASSKDAAAMEAASIPLCPRCRWRMNRYQNCSSSTCGERCAPTSPGDRRGATIDGSTVTLLADGLTGR